MPTTPWFSLPLHDLFKFSSVFMVIILSHSCKISHLNFSCVYSIPYYLLPLLWVCFGLQSIFLSLLSSHSVLSAIPWSLAFLNLCFMQFLCSVTSEMNLLFLRVCLQSCPAVSLKSYGLILSNTPATFFWCFSSLVGAWREGRRSSQASAVFLLNSPWGCVLFPMGLPLGAHLC